jgi:hypothetical protein
MKGPGTRVFDYGIDGNLTPESTAGAPLESCGTPTMVEAEQAAPCASVIL